MAIDTNKTIENKKDAVTKSEVKKIDTNISTPIPEQKLKKEIKKEITDINTSNKNKIIVKDKVLKPQNLDTNQTIRD